MSVVYGLLSALVLLVLSVTLHGLHGPGLFDRPVTAAVRAAWPRVGLMGHIVDRLANPIAATLLVTALAGGCLLMRRGRLSIVAAVGPLSAVGSATVLKQITGRSIHGGNLAFPSGHTAFATSVALLIGLLVVGVTRLGRSFSAALLTVTALLGGGGMALNQVALNAHYPSDTVGGFCTAVAVMSLTALLTDSLARVLQRPRRRSRRAAEVRTRVAKLTRV